MAMTRKIQFKIVMTQNTRSTGRLAKCANGNEALHRTTLNALQPAPTVANADYQEEYTMMTMELMILELLVAAVYGRDLVPPEFKA